MFAIRSFQEPITYGSGSDPLRKYGLRLPYRQEPHSSPRDPLLDSIRERGQRRMPRAPISDFDDNFALMMMLDAADRAARYREQAVRFRQLAQAELDDGIRQSLLEVARQYEDLANSLDPRHHDGA